jgi:hypothetical protein
VGPNRAITGGGGGLVMVDFFFSDVTPFLGRERPGRREKIMSDLKKCNESWSIGRGRLARETLTIKCHGLCDIMLVCSLAPSAPSLRAASVLVRQLQTSLASTLIESTYVIYSLSLSVFSEPRRKSFLI